MHMPNLKLTVRPNHPPLPVPADPNDQPPPGPGLLNRFEYMAQRLPVIAFDSKAMAAIATVPALAATYLCRNENYLAATPFILASMGVISIYGFGQLFYPPSVFSRRAADIPPS